MSRGKVTTLCSFTVHTHSFLLYSDVSPTCMESATEYTSTGIHNIKPAPNTSDSANEFSNRFRYTVIHLCRSKKINKKLQEIIKKIIPSITDMNVSVSVRTRAVGFVYKKRFQIEKFQIEFFLRYLYFRFYTVCICT